MDLHIVDGCDDVTDPEMQSGTFHEDLRAGWEAREPVFELQRIRAIRPDHEQHPPFAGHGCRSAWRRSTEGHQGDCTGTNRLRHGVRSVKVLRRAARTLGSMSTVHPSRTGPPTLDLD